MLFVISATGASILDVLEAYDTPGSTRPFDPNLYSWESVFVRRGLWFYHQKIDATMPYGAYHVVNTREEGNDIVYYRAGDGSMAPEQRLVTDQILAFEANYQSMLRQESGSDRVEIIAETLVAGYLSTKPRDVDQLGLLAGYTCLIGRDSWGQGPQLKLVVPVPEIGLQSYIYEGFRWYYNSQGHVGRPFGGIGAETGFGLYFLRVNLSEENYLQGPKIRQTPALSFGLGITITLNRLLHL